MVLAPSLLHKSSMTKKRVKFGLAILGGLAAFLLALLALVFAPTGASAGKGPAFGQEQDGGGHSGHPDPAYFNNPPNGNGNDNDSHHASGGGGNPCAATPNPCDGHDNGAPGTGAWHYAGGQGGQGDGQGQDQGNGHSSNNDSGGQGGYGNPGFAGGYPGGGGGYGAPHNTGSCSSKKDEDKDAKDKESDNKTCDSDDDNNDDNNGNSNNSGDNSGNNAGYEQLTLLGDKPPSDDSNDDDPSDGTSGNPPTNLLNNDTPPGDDDDLPPVDPDCFPFAESCDTHNGNPPTDQTDPTHEVPEPLTLSLFAVGLAGAATLRRRQQKTAAQPD